jgi:hypothetical protein
MKKSLFEYKAGLIIEVNDLMQKDYSYKLVAPIGKNFDPEFKPEITPDEMLKLGVFEGHYLNDCEDEFPVEWYESARDKLSPLKADISKNCFKIKSRQNLNIWQEKGWIIEPDPRGWFQWYCRYYLGRRITEVDKKQIKRWKAYKRHKAQIEKNCRLGDLECRPKQRQGLLQWAYNPFI